MSEIQKYDQWQQRTAMNRVADTRRYGTPFGYLNTADGVAFVEQVKEFLAVPMCKFAWNNLNVHLEVAEVVNVILTGLVANEADVARRASLADNPFGYVAVCAQRWIRQLVGVQGVEFELVEQFVSVPGVDEQSLDRSIEEAVAKTYHVFEPVTPKNLRDGLYHLLEWFAANPIQRLSYEVHEKQAAHRVVPEMTIEQVTAVMNIAWGARPRQEETSFLGAFLRDPDFDFRNSTTHLRAIGLYQKTMEAGKRGSRLLADWK